MCSPSLCTLSASTSIHPPTPTFGRFLLEIYLFKFLVSSLFLLHNAAHTLASSAHVHRQNGVQQLMHSAPRSKSTGFMLQLRSKQSAKAPPPENSLATGGSFERNTFLVMALDWLKKEDERF